MDGKGLVALWEQTIFFRQYFFSRLYIVCYISNFINLAQNSSNTFPPQALLRKDIIFLYAHQERKIIRRWNYNL